MFVYHKRWAEKERKEKRSLSEDSVIAKKECDSGQVDNSVVSIDCFRQSKTRTEVVAHQ